jgi:hypothetical protein
VTFGKLLHPDEEQGDESLECGGMTPLCGASQLKEGYTFSFNKA